MKGGSLYISLTNDPFCIKCHLLITILLTLGTDGLHCLAKGINPLCTLSGFCSNVDLLLVNWTSARTLFTR